jgi:hypothetical protein
MNSGYDVIVICAARARGALDRCQFDDRCKGDE